MLKDTSSLQTAMQAAVLSAHGKPPQDSKSHAVSSAGASPAVKSISALRAKYTGKRLSGAALRAIAASAQSQTTGTDQQET